MGPFGAQRLLKGHALLQGNVGEHWHPFNKFQYKDVLMTVSRFDSGRKSGGILGNTIVSLNIDVPIIDLLEKRPNL